jgi:hypothetical protein
MGDLQRKHLLSLVTRKIPDAFKFVPRSYVLPSSTGTAESEFEIFCCDFQLSHSLARAAQEIESLKKKQRQTACTAYLQSRPEGTSTGVESTAMEVASLQRTLSRCHELLRSFAAHADLAMTVPEPKQTGDVVRWAEQWMRTVSSELPELQLNILVSNLWVLKPIDGAMGKGIVVFGGTKDIDSCAILPSAVNALGGAAAPGGAGEEEVTGEHRMEKEGENSSMPDSAAGPIL